MPQDLGWRQAVVGEAGSPTSSAAADQLLFGSGPNRCISLVGRGLPGETPGHKDKRTRDWILSGKSASSQVGPPSL